MKRRHFVVGCAALGAGAGIELGLGCGPTEVEDTRRQLLTSWGQRFLLASYAEFETLASELESRSRALCQTPGIDALDAARGAWWAARAPWKRTEVFAFGPYTDEPQRFGPQIDFWPARPDTVDELLSGTAPLTAEARRNSALPPKAFRRSSTCSTSLESTSSLRFRPRYAAASICSRSLRTWSCELVSSGRRGNPIRATISAS